MFASVENPSVVLQSDSGFAVKQQVSVSFYNWQLNIVRIAKCHLNITFAIVY